MAKITRIFQPIFASTPGFEQVGQFGSFEDGAPVYTTNPQTIMGLPNWLQGWNGAIIGANSPCIEDMNGAFLAITSQLAYLFQSGIAEWEDETTYYIGSIATDGSGVRYKSITDDNIGNPLSDSTNWILADLTLRTANANVTVPALYNWTTSNVTVGDGITYTVEGSAEILNEVTVSGTGVFTVTGTGRTI